MEIILQMKKILYVCKMILDDNNHTMKEIDKVIKATEYIQSITKYTPTIGLILGSGLGVLANDIEDPDIIPYDDIPNFPVSTVPGHAGQLVIGKLQGKIVLAMQGRIHFYEGYSMKEVVFPTRVMKALGIETMIVTNACGGLNPDLYAGALVLIKDHINMLFDNSLIGAHDDRLGSRFPDMLNTYTPRLRDLAKEVATKNNIEVFEGVHMAISGPCFETEAEAKMFRLLGADTIGMSTIPEVIVAKQSNMNILGIACVTDMEIPGKMHSVTHEEVLAVAEKIRPKFIKLVSKIVAEM